MNTERIILPLDGMTLEEAMVIVYKTKDKVWGWKVNDLFFEYGTSIITAIKRFGGRVMADAKLYDIPNTMNNTLNKILLAKADIITVHMEPGYVPVDKIQADKIAGVTILTSMSKKRVNDVYHGVTFEMVEEFIEDAIRLNYGYVVCSGEDLIDNVFNSKIKKICPGIRPQWSMVADDDQKRITTPTQAVKNGADLLVIGRPILTAPNMLEALDKTNKEIEEALKNEL